MTLRVLVAVILSAASVSCGGGSEGQSGDARLRFTAIPDQNTTELQEKFRPLERYLSGLLEVEVRYLPARDYQGAVEMFVNGDVGLAWFGGLTGVQARSRVPRARAIAQGAADRAYYSYFIAHRDTGLTKSDGFPIEIAKHPFTFGPQQSTSGRLMPEYFIRQHTGEAPQAFFRQPVGFSGSHDQTLELVASGRFSAGVVNYDVYETRVAQGKIDPDVVRVIWRTPPYSDYNWTARPDLDVRFGAGFTERLTRALLEVTDRSLLAALRRQRLVPASNDDYEAIGRVARQLDMLR